MLQGAEWAGGPTVWLSSVPAVRAGLATGLGSATSPGGALGVGAPRTSPLERTGRGVMQAGLGSGSGGLH